MLTVMFGCALWKSGMSFFRSVIDGLSTEPTVMVVVPLDPPPPAPEQATVTSAIIAPSITANVSRLDVPRFLSLMQSHLFFIRRDPDGPLSSCLTTLSKDNVV